MEKRTKIIIAFIANIIIPIILVLATCFLGEKYMTIGTMIAAFIYGILIYLDLDLEKNNHND